MLSLTVNGTTHQYSGEADTPLLWYLRDELGLKGTKFGCGVGVCGICTVLIDGEPNHACMVTMARVANRHVETIEGLVEKNHPVLHAWISQQVPQCGYCQPGQLMAAAALLNRIDLPDESHIRTAMTPVLCRCGTYQRIARAIRYAAQLDAENLPDLKTICGLPRPTHTPGGVVLDDWIRIEEDNCVTIIINHSEMGQGAVTGLAMLVAEELEVALSQVRTELAPAARRYRNPLFNEQTTGGSTSIRGEWDRLREAGAKARWRLIEAAAQSWQVPHEQCRAQDAVVYHDATQRQLCYSKLAQHAALLRAPSSVTLKSVQQYRLLGHSQLRLEIPAMVTAQVEYGADVHLPGLVYAAIARKPFPGTKLQSMDEAVAKNCPGVIDVRVVSSGLAVIADSTWAAIRGLSQLNASWKNPNAQNTGSEIYQSQLVNALQKSGKVVTQIGNSKRVMAKAKTVVEATYLTSFLAHGTLEPMNCTARVADGRCDVWVGTQSQEGAQIKAAEVCGLPVSKVYIHSTYLGGGFGRRLESDFVAEAVELSLACGKPVQVLWSRADDLQHDYYRPAHASLVQAVLDERGGPLAWRQRSAGDAMALDMVDVPYNIPNYSEERVKVKSPLPVGAWRSVGAGQNAFVVESFIDELAHAAGADPVKYRFELLANSPRAQRVLQCAAEQAGWYSRHENNCYQGVAQYYSFGSWVAHVVEVEVVQNEIFVHRVVCAIDCGFCVNPDAVVAQMESAVVMGLSAALKEQVRFANGMVNQTSFKDYPILAFSETPLIEVHIVPSHKPPGGVGEPGLPPVAPAVGNAIFAATGKRLRSLPFQMT